MSNLPGCELCGWIRNHSEVCPSYKYRSSKFPNVLTQEELSFAQYCFSLGFCLYSARGGTKWPGPLLKYYADTQIHLVRVSLVESPSSISRSFEFLEDLSLAIKNRDKDSFRKYVELEAIANE